MTQLGQASPVEGERANRHRSRVTALIFVLSLLGGMVVCSGASAHTVVYTTPHIRHRVVRRNAHRSTQRAGNVRAATHRTAPASAARKEGSYRPGAERGRRLHSAHEPHRTSHVRVARSARRGRGGAPETRRVNLRRRRRRRRFRSGEPEVLAEAGRGNGLGPAEERASGRQPVLDPGSNRGVEEASGEGEAMTGGYATGVAHPDEDVSVAPQAVGASPEAETSADVAEARPERRDAPEPSMAPGAGTDLREQPAVGVAQTAVQPMVSPVVEPVLYHNGRLAVTPPLRGSREILEHQNVMADAEGLNRVEDDAELRQMRADHLLLDFPESAALRVNPELESDRRCARPWTVLFATDIARAYYARFHEPLQVNSAVRTVAYQLRLRRVNGNAAGIEGDLASPHLTGEAMDFGKHGMTRVEIAWMRLYLRPLMQAGKLDVEEEFQQACFHISVYRSYAPELQRREFARAGQPEHDYTGVQAGGYEQ